MREPWGVRMRKGQLNLAKPEETRERALVVYAAWAPRRKRSLGKAFIAGILDLCLRERTRMQVRAKIVL